MRIWPLIPLCVLCLLLFGCIEGDTKPADTIVIKDNAEPPTDVDIDIEVEDDNTDDGGSSGN